MRRVETDASLSMPREDKTSPGPDAPTPRAGVQFPFCASTGRPWTAAGPRSSLTSLSAGRWRSHIKLSEDPKVPVRSVNSSIVPAPPDSKGQVPREVTLQHEPKHADVHDKLD
ncbi:hypothetical protein EYF80_036634 [Liparis tanakae]|uniref:Uncharacterized protein n=1 Tax=Liparis tanakae TaxID=230148 RepID=A0A4Z2GJY0_9TELE|nr:hypothetical protein EYF80_036634 [Liparis tanakae]